MNEEPFMKEEDAKQIIAMEASINIATAYCKRCFVEVNRETNRANCQSELEMLSEQEIPASVSAEELLDTCKNCDYRAAYIADALEEE